jgi:hypothetical protein
MYYEDGQWHRHYRCPQGPRDPRQRYGRHPRYDDDYGYSDRPYRGRRRSYYRDYDRYYDDYDRYNGRRYGDYYDRGARFGAGIGAQIGEAIGGEQGRRIGAGIGARVGGDID